MAEKPTFRGSSFVHLIRNELYSSPHNTQSPYVTARFPHVKLGDESAGRSSGLRSCPVFRSGDPRTAMARYRSALQIAPDDGALWISLTRAILAVQPANGREGP